MKYLILPQDSSWRLCPLLVIHRYSNIFFWGDVSMAQLVASMSGVVLGGDVEVLGSNLAKGIIFTVSIGSVGSLYPSVFIYCVNLHQFLILCSSKAMMFVKLYFRTSDIYLISLYPWIHQAFTCEPNRCHPLKRNQYTTCIALVVVNISATWTSFFGDVSVAQLVELMSGVVLGGVVEVVGSNLIYIDSIYQLNWFIISLRIYIYTQQDLDDVTRFFQIRK